MTTEPLAPERKAAPSMVWWLLFLSCPLLLLLGGVQIAQLLEWAATLPPAQSAELVQGLGLTLLPIFAFALVSALVATRYVRYNTSSSLQTRMQGIQNRQNYHEDLVRLIADNRPGATMIIDSEKRLWFVNNKAASHINIPAQKVIGLPFEKTFPESEVLRLTALLQQHRQTGQTVESIDKVTADGVTRYIQTHIIPLPDVANMTGAVMINQDDVTNFLVEREARERMFRQVIDTLVAIVDRRDPYAAGHSARVGQIARALAEQLRLDAGQVETAEIAGQLMNFGKVLVPRAILVKTGVLSSDELKQVHESLLSSADILALIGFSQPVVPTLRQAQERVDGSGIPNGLKGDAILITARVVAVANAFVALLSARAHRPSMNVATAIEVLIKDAGKIYDRQVIEALTASIATRKHQLDWLP